MVLRSFTGSSAALIDASDAMRTPERAIRLAHTDRPLRASTWRALIEFVVTQKWRKGER
jgi:hypothetical protein